MAKNHCHWQTKRGHWQKPWPLANKPWPLANKPWPLAKKACPLADLSMSAVFWPMATVPLPISTGFGHGFSANVYGLFNSRGFFANGHGFCANVHEFFAELADFCADGHGFCLPLFTVNGLPMATGFPPPPAPLQGSHHNATPQKAYFIGVFAVHIVHSVHASLLRAHLAGYALRKPTKM